MHDHRHDNIELAVGADNAPPSPRERAATATTTAEQGARPRLGEVLKMYQLIDDRQLQEALAVGRERGIRIGQALIQMGVLCQDQINWALAHHLQIPYIALTDDMITPALVRRLPERLLRHYQIMPLVEVDGALTVAMADPTDLAAIEALERAAGQQVMPSLAAPEAIERTLDAVFAPKGSPAASTSDLFSTINPLDIFIARAVAAGADQLQIRPMIDALRIVFCSDTEISEQTGPLTSYLPIVKRLRKLAELADEPQRFHRTVFDHAIGDVRLRVRCEVTPTIHGDAITLTFLGRRPSPRLDDLELPDEITERIKPLLQQGCGLALVVGPDERQNIALLHALLDAAPGQRPRVVTIEQSSHFEHDDALQISLEELPLVTRGQAVDHALAGRPQVLLLDRLLELPRADLTPLLRAAMAETLVLSSIETSDPLHALSLLRQLAPPPALLASSLSFVLSRTPLRLLCQECSTPTTSDDPALARIGIGEQDPATTPARARGCQACRQRGTAGVIPLHGLIENGASLQRALIDEVTPGVLAELIAEALFAAHERARRLVRSARVAPDEVMTRLSWARPQGRSVR